MLIKSSDGGELIGERDNVRSLSSPIIRPVTDPSAARLISTTLMKLAKQLLSALRHHGRKRVCVCRVVKERRNGSNVQKSSAETQKCKRQENSKVWLQRENVSERRSIRFTSSL